MKSRKYIISGRRQATPLQKNGLGLINLGILVWTLSAAQALAWGPWSTSPSHPIVQNKKSLAATHQETPGPAGQSLEILLTVYQEALSPMLTNQCRMHPSCSRFSRQALRKHGAWRGIMLTADRLIHESDEQRFAPRIYVLKETRFLDPVSNNDFWWTHE